MAELHLTPEQEAEAQALFRRLKTAFEDEALQLARLMASKDDRHLLGATEFEVRDRVHRLGAQALQTALAERKKGGTTAAAPPARAAARRPGASPSAARRSSPRSAPSGSNAITTTAPPVSRAFAPGMRCWA